MKIAQGGVAEVTQTAGNKKPGSTANGWDGLRKTTRELLNDVRRFQGVGSGNGVFGQAERVFA